MPILSSPALRSRLLATLAATSTWLFATPSAQAAAGDVVISEFRVRGPSGANDEFVELYNRTAADITVTATDATAGWAVAASDGVARFVVPNGTIIPAHGHYLGVNNIAYSLSGYATGDATWTTDIVDNAGIALFSSSTDFSLGTRLDAVGSTAEANPLYKEGTGYPALTPFSIDSSFYRFHLQGAATAGISDPSIAITDGEPRDTDNNAVDFAFVDTNGTSAGGGQRLGAP